MEASSRFLLALGLLLVIPACSDADAIRQYQVDKEPAAAAPDQEGVAWFFKLVGPKDAVAMQVQPFGELVRSVNFSAAGLPDWKRPAEWHERREEGLRFATLTTSGNPPLEVSVIPLPHAAPSSPAYLRENFNRWRAQLGLATVEGEDWFDKSRKAGELAQVESHGRTVTIVNLVGETSEFPQARMLAALIPTEAPMRPEASATSPGQNPAPTDPLPFSYTLPEGWAQGSASSFEVAVFFAGSGAKAVKVSVSTAGGDLAANVNRWRSQVGLLPVEPADIESAATSVTVGGNAAQLFAVDGPEESILGVIVPHEGGTWFFKARGPKEQVAGERPHFDAFLKSIAFNH